MFMIDYATTEELEEMAGAYYSTDAELYARNVYPEMVCEGCEELGDKCSCDIELRHFIWRPDCEEGCCP